MKFGDMQICQLGCFSKSVTQPQEKLRTAIEWRKEFLPFSLIRQQKSFNESFSSSSAGNWCKLIFTFFVFTCCWFCHFKFWCDRNLKFDMKWTAAWTSGSCISADELWVHRCCLVCKIYAGSVSTSENNSQSSWCHINTDDCTLPASATWFVKKNNSNSKKNKKQSVETRWSWSDCSWRQMSIWHWTSLFLTKCPWQQDTETSSGPQRRCRRMKSREAEWMRTQQYGFGPAASWPHMKKKWNKSSWIFFFFKHLSILVCFLASILWESGKEKQFGNFFFIQTSCVQFFINLLFMQTLVYIRFTLYFNLKPSRVREHIHTILTSCRHHAETSWENQLKVLKWSFHTLNYICIDPEINIYNCDRWMVSDYQWKRHKNHSG